MGALEQEEVAAPAPASAPAQAMSGPAPLAASTGGNGLAPRQRAMLGLQASAGNAGVARAIAAGGAVAGPPRIMRDPAPAAAAAPAPATSVTTSLLQGIVSEIPGYGVLTLIAGEDIITGEQVTVSRQSIVEQLLGHGPFAAGIGPVLSAMDVLEDIYKIVMSTLGEHGLTLARIKGDMAAAWKKVDTFSLPSTNLAIVEGYVTKIIADVKAFAKAIADRLIKVVRDAAAKAAEPYLQKPSIAPIWNLARKVMHYDPLKDERVDAPTIEILTDFLRLIGEEKRLEQMQKEGTLQKTADWLDKQYGTFMEIVGQAKALFTDAWDAISPQNLPILLSTLPALADRAVALFGKVRNFAQTVITQVLVLIKEALLGLLSQHAHKVPGFHLMTVILGKNPFTDAPVPRTPQNLIKGFITLMPGGEATYEQLEESGVIASAAARIEGAMARLNITWDLITGTFKAIWDGLQLNDLIDPIGAFGRIIGQFGEPLNRIFEFISEVVQVVVELILKLMDFPSDLLASIIANAKAAIADIKKNPVGFLKNLLATLKQGVMGFFNNVIEYLRDGLAAWLLRGLGKLGITLPADYSIGSVLKTIMEVLGVGIEQLWAKLSKRMGEQKVSIIRKSLDKLEGALAFIKDVQEGGIGAIWKYIQDQLGNLWDTLLGMAKDWIMGEIVEKVIGRLISMLDPTGIMAVVRSFQAFFNAVQSAIEYLKDILTIVNDYVSTLAQVAAGNITAGAQKLEKGLATAIPVAIGFLANQVGIGNIPEKIVEIITGFREMVDKALDWLVDKAVSLGEKALGMLGIGGKEDGKKDEKGDGELAPAVAEADALLTTPGATEDSVNRDLAAIRARHQLRSANLVRGHAGRHRVVLARTETATPEHVLGADPRNVQLTEADLRPIRERPTWTSAQRSEMASPAGPWAALHQVGEVSSVRTGFDRRHIRPWEQLRDAALTRMGLVVGGTVGDAAISLGNAQYPPAAQTVAAVTEAARAYIRDQVFYDYRNLWVGPSADNQARGTLTQHLPGVIDKLRLLAGALDQGDASGAAKIRQKLLSGSTLPKVAGAADSVRAAQTGAEVLAVVSVAEQALANARHDPDSAAVG